jgi:hypothetical protein
VCSAAAVQWRGGDHPWAHRRYGRVGSTLKAWSPHPGRAVISCDVPAAGLGNLSWDEETRFERGRWTQLAEEAVCQRLRPGVEVLIAHPHGPKVPEFLRMTHLKVGVDETAFGPGRWLRLNPPAVAFKGTLTLPLEGIQIAVRRIILDESGVHLPGEVRVAYLGTFPTPYCCLSDPQIRVYPPEGRLEISGKLTPPLVQPAAPGGAGRAATTPPPRAGSLVPRQEHRAGALGGALRAPLTKQLRHAYGFPDHDPRLLRLDMSVAVRQ